MGIDLRQLPPGKLAGLLNSTALGEVTNEPRVRRNVVRAGLRVGDGRRVNVVAYGAWLLSTWHAQVLAAAAAGPRLTGYDALRESARARNAELSAAGRDIGPIPKVHDAQRKEKAAGDFRFFCEAYFPRTFYLPWSDDHLKATRKIEDAVLRGGLFAYAMPRGSGKTVMVETACIWAILYGHRPFVALIGSDEEHAPGCWTRSRRNWRPTRRSWRTSPRRCIPSTAWRASPTALPGRPTRAPGR